MSDLKPFVLDLGAAHVKVEAAELHEEACGMALLGERRIIIDPRKNDGQAIGQTLWHEILHHLDDLFLGKWLDRKYHNQLDTLANLIDMVLTRNWKVIRTIYDAKAKVR